MMKRFLLLYFLSTFHFYNVEGIVCFTATINPSSLSVMAGNTLVYKYVSISVTGACGLTTTDGSAVLNSDFTVSATDTDGNPIGTLHDFNFGDSSFKTMTVTITAIDDNDALETFDISLACSYLGNQCPTIDRQISITAKGSGGGDPHFFQTVSDLKTGIFFDICYDVIGQSGQVIDIFSERRLKIAVKGQLFDDYFMHKMLIFYPKFNFTFEKTGCFVNGIFLTDWETNEGPSRFKVNNFSIKKSKNQIDIFSDDYLKFPISVFKKPGPYGNFYLDVAVSGLGKNYTDQDGLLGKMGKGKFELFRGVQADSITGIKINGIQRSASQLTRNGKKCLFINVADGLYPKSISDYIK